MKKVSGSLLAVCSMAILLSSCTVHQRTIADSNSHVQFVASDWTITPPYGGQARVTRVLGIDWARLFTQRAGGHSGMSNSISFPVIGWLAPTQEADRYAMFDLLEHHTGYDALFYPQFKRKRFNFLGLYSRTTSELTARLGKLNAGTGEGDREGQR